jgi:hypothetical protein
MLYTATDFVLSSASEVCKSIAINIFIPLFLAYFPNFEKIKVGLWDHLAVCVSPRSTFEFLNQSLLNLVCISWHLSPSQWHTS